MDVEQAFFSKSGSDLALLFTSQSIKILAQHKTRNVYTNTMSME